MGTIKNPAPSIALDAEAIGIFCDHVFGYLEGLAPIRLLPETGIDNCNPRVEFVPTEKAVARLAAIGGLAATDGRGVFVVPGTVATAGTARASDIIQTGVILVDLDDGDIAAKRDHLVRHLGPASLEVASGGRTSAGQPKQHLYWRLTEAASGPDLQRVADLRAEIADKVGGDRSFASLHQPIRVAGTIHGKHGRFSPVRLLASSDREYDLTEFAGAIASLPAMKEIRLPRRKLVAGNTGPSAGDLATMRIREGGVDDTTRFTAISKVIGHWVRNLRLGRCTEAWVAVQQHNAAMIVPPWDETRLRREFDAILKKDARSTAITVAIEVDAVNDDVLVALSEDALAAAFRIAHGLAWRHVPAWGAWMHWTGLVWERDETRRVRDLARRVCRAAATRVEKPGEARRIASERTASAVLRLAATDPRLAIRSQVWDAHPLLLNTPGGVVDLETSEIMSPKPDRYLTQITAASPGVDCPKWTDFLREITDGDEDLQGYLARLAGYCLTGFTSEQIFAFLHGHGANGKSVFLQTVASVMGSYAATATLDTFMSSKADRHLTELAGLRAARLVLVTETEVGRSWAESRIKTVTGGEKIRANYMRQDHFEFTPQFKLLVAGNHRPELGSTGEAMRRRLHVVPFTVTIPPDRRDRDLAQKLLAERDGILGWMLRGCAEWRRIGLAPPNVVAAAAADYFESEDQVGQWITECCVCGAGQRASSSELFGSWKAWSEARGFAPGSQKSLGDSLRARGHVPLRSGRGRGWAGLALRGAVFDQDPAP